jgi:curved DNA-binding protein CbpA
VRDPYEVLGVRQEASDEEVRTAYRRLVQLHHPDHNGGSAESAQRFEEVQEAYAQVTRLRREGAAPPGGGAPPPDPDLEARMADIERQVREAHEARERARHAAAEAAARTERRPTDEELGYVRTDDRFSAVMADARSELAARLSEGGSSSATDRVADMLEELAAKLRRESRGSR